MVPRIRFRCANLSFQIYLLLVKIAQVSPNDPIGSNATPLDQVVLCPESASLGVERATVFIPEYSNFSNHLWIVFYRNCKIVEPSHLTFPRDVSVVIEWVNDWSRQGKRVALRPGNRGEDCK
jgi:hypothetical protein